MYLDKLEQVFPSNYSLVIFGEDKVPPRLKLLLPVPEHGGGAHDEKHAVSRPPSVVVVIRAEPDPPAGGEVFLRHLGPLEESRDEANDLNGLAKAHVVGQDGPALLSKACQTTGYPTTPPTVY